MEVGENERQAPVWPLRFLCMHTSPASQKQRQLCEGGRDTGRLEESGGRAVGEPLSGRRVSV